MMRSVLTARFWCYFGGRWVRLALRDGQSVTMHDGAPTDEGYSYESETFTREGDLIVSEYTSEARDCDGRLDRHATYVCPIDRLQAREANEYQATDLGAGARLPDWQDGHAWQRDYEAEAAGY